MTSLDDMIVKHLRELMATEGDREAAFLNIFPRAIKEGSGLIGERAVDLMAQAYAAGLLLQAELFKQGCVEPGSHAELMRDLGALYASGKAAELVTLAGRPE